MMMSMIEMMIGLIDNDSFIMTMITIVVITFKNYSEIDHADYSNLFHCTLLYLTLPYPTLPYSTLL